MHVYVLARPDIDEHCDEHYAGCVSRGDVFIASDRFEEVLTHEIVHERVGRTMDWTKPLFNEGIASSIGKPHSVPIAHNPSPIDAYLSVRTGEDLLDLRHGYYERDESDMTRANLICTGAELTRDPERPRFKLEAELTCDSPRVENQWAFRDRAYVEWTIEIEEDSAGRWAPVRFEGDEAIPADTFLEIVPCHGGRRGQWTANRNGAVWLSPGLHRVRWYGPMDGPTLDLELGGPCDEAADCRPNERCNTHPAVCVPAL